MERQLRDAESGKGADKDANVPKDVVLQITDVAFRDGAAEPGPWSPTPIRPLLRSCSEMSCARLAPLAASPLAFGFWQPTNVVSGDEMSSARGSASTSGLASAATTSDSEANESAPYLTEADCSWSRRRERRRDHRGITPSIQEKARRGKTRGTLLKMRLKCVHPYFKCTFFFLQLC